MISELEKKGKPGNPTPGFPEEKRAFYGMEVS